MKYKYNFVKEINKCQCIWYKNELLPIFFKYDMRKEYEDKIAIVNMYRWYPTQVFAALEERLKFNVTYSEVSSNLIIEHLNKLQQTLTKVNGSHSEYQDDFFTNYAINHLKNNHLKDIKDTNILKHCKQEIDDVLCCVDKTLYTVEYSQAYKRVYDYLIKNI